MSAEKTAEEVALKLFPGCGGSSGEQCDYCDRQKDRREWFLKLITAARAEGEQVGHARGVAEERERAAKLRDVFWITGDIAGDLLWYEASAPHAPHSFMGRVNEAAAQTAESLALGNSPEDFDALMGGGR